MYDALNNKDCLNFYIKKYLRKYYIYIDAVFTSQSRMDFPVCLLISVHLLGLLLT